MFCSETGGFTNPMYLQKAFHELLKDTGLPHMRFHDLRHSAITILLSMGVQPHVVAEIVGHSDVRITLGVYGHVLPNMYDEAMRKMEDLFGNE